MKNKRLLIILSVIVILLLIPFIAMQFTTEVNWTLLDFVLMGFLLVVTGISCELVLRKVNKASYRIAICLAVIAVFFIIWAQLAIDIF